MKQLKLSPKLERATEDYLVSVGSSRECLTDEQFRVVAQYVKERKSQLYCTVILPVLVVIKVLLIIAVFIMSKYFVESVIPNDIKEVVLISPAGESRFSPIMLNMEFTIVAAAGWICGIFSVQLIGYLIDIFVGLRFREQKQSEILECFLPKTHGLSSVE